MKTSNDLATPERIDMSLLIKDFVASYRKQKNYDDQSSVWKK